MDIGTSFVLLIWLVLFLPVVAIAFCHKLSALEGARAGALHWGHAFLAVVPFFGQA